MKILELDLYTTNLEAVHFFYAGRLGLPVLSHSASRLTVLVGYTRLTFQLVDKPVAPYYMVFDVPRNSLDVLMYCYDLDYLSTQTPEKSTSYNPDSHTKTCYFYDPCGNLIQLIDRAVLNLADPNLTLPELFRGVSQIGLTTQNVDYTANEIRRRFHLELTGQSTSETDCSAPVDNKGLFILAQQGRPWLFTNTQADLNYCRVQFTMEEDGPIQELYSYEVNQLPIGYVVDHYQRYIFGNHNNHSLSSLLRIGK